MNAKARPDLQPVLRGKLLQLRPLRGDDFDALFAVAADPLIWEQRPARDRYQPAVFRAFFDEAMASGGAARYEQLVFEVVLTTSEVNPR